MMHNNAVEQEREELAIRLNFDPFTSRRGGGGAPLVRARPAIRSIQIIFYIRYFSSDIFHLAHRSYPVHRIPSRLHRETLKEVS